MAPADVVSIQSRQRLNGLKRVITPVQKTPAPEIAILELMALPWVMMAGLLEFHRQACVNIANALSQ
ncbi:MAG TPA: hypothetical protein VHP58_02055 [Alphaproteobacteria bacterium]|nr:hypothetical protein [Alphaproteobacteria bacterium]